MKKILILALSVWVLVSVEGKCEKTEKEWNKYLKEHPEFLKDHIVDHNIEIIELKTKVDAYKEILLNIDKVLHDKKILKKDESIL